LLPLTLLKAIFDPCFLTTHSIVSDSFQRAPNVFELIHRTYTRCCPISSFHEVVDFSSASRKAAALRNQEHSPAFKQYKTVITDESLLSWLSSLGLSEPTKLHRELLLNAADGKSYVILGGANSGKRSLGIISALKISRSLGEMGASAKNLFLFDDDSRLEEFAGYLASLNLEAPYAEASKFSELNLESTDLDEYSLVFLDVSVADSFEKHADTIRKALAANSQILLSCVSDSPELRRLVATGNPDISFYSTDTKPLNRKLVEKETVISCLNSEKAGGLLVCLNQSIEQKKSALVYCNHHADAKNLAEVYSRRGINAVAHTFSNKPRSFHKLEKALEQDEPIIIFGTDASLKGLYNPAISLLVHYDIAETSLHHVARYAQFDAVETSYESVVFVCDEAGVNLLAVNDALGKEWVIESTQPVGAVYPLGDLEPVSVPSRAERKAEAKRRRQEEKRNGGRGRGGPRGGPRRDGDKREGRPARDRDDRPREDKPREDRKSRGDRPQRDSKPRDNKPRDNKPRRDRGNSRPRRNVDESNDGRPGKRRRGLPREEGQRDIAAKSPSSSRQKPRSQKNKQRRHGGKPRSNGLRKPVNPSLSPSNISTSSSAGSSGGILSKVGSKIKKFFTFS